MGILLPDQKPKHVRSIALFLGSLGLSFKPERMSTTVGNTLSTVNVSGWRASKKRQRVVFYASVFVSSDSEWFGFSAVMLLQGYSNLISRDDAVRDPTIPVKSTSTCIWSRTTLALKLPDKWLRSNGRKGCVCFRLRLKLQDKTWADFPSSQRHNYFVSVCVMRLTITIFTARLEIQENCCCDEDYREKQENEREARTTQNVGENNHLDHSQPQWASAPAAITVQPSACSCSSDLQTHLSPLWGY